MNRQFKPQLVVGILGGMGPYATLSFMEMIIRLTPAKKDWNHIHLVIDNNPHIPSRTRAYLYKEKSPVNEMISCCKKLQQYPVDIIAVPCNSAMYFIDDVVKKISVPILNIIEVTSRRAKRYVSPGKRIAVWGGMITYKEKLYKTYLEKEGFEYIDHSEEDQNTITSYIENIKLDGNLETKSYDQFLKNYLDNYSPDVIILGCTEFGCLTGLKTEKYGISLIDSDTELALHIVEMASGSQT